MSEREVIALLVVVGRHTGLRGRLDGCCGRQAQVSERRDRDVLCPIA